MPAASKRAGQQDESSPAKKARGADDASSSSDPVLDPSAIENVGPPMDGCEKRIDPDWSGIHNPEIVEAASDADVDRMLELMKDHSPTDQDKYNGYSALHVASGIVKWDKKNVANRADMIKRMLEHDECDPNIKDDSKMTPLHWCAWVAKQKVDVIISAMCTPRRDSKTGTSNVVQIDPDVQDCRGDTPLMIACRASNHYAVKPLLAVGANPNLPNKCGFVPLHYACYNGNVDTVRALLESYEADVNFQAKGTGTTPLHFAQQDFNEKSGKAEVFKLLLEKGANAEVADVSGHSVSFKACTLPNADKMKSLLKTVNEIADPSKRLCWSCKSQLSKKMFKYTDWVIVNRLINCVACVAKKAREDSESAPLYVEVDPTKLAGIVYTGTQLMAAEPDDFITFQKKKYEKTAKERANYNYHSNVNAGQAAFMFQAQFGDKPYRLDPNLDEKMDEKSISDLIREVGGNPITSGKTKTFNSKKELQMQLEHLVYRPCIDYRDDRLEVLEIHDPANPASLFSSESKPCYGLFLKKNAKPVKKGTVLGEYAGKVQDSERLTSETAGVKNEDEENAKNDISMMDEEYLMTLQTTCDVKYYTIKKGSYAVVNARVHRNEMGFINDFRGIQEMGRDKRTGDREKNIEFRDVVIDNWPRLFGTAVRDINPGEEILVDYGEHYWQVQEGLRQDHLKMMAKVERAKWVGELKEMSRSMKMCQGLLDAPELPAALSTGLEEQLQKLKHHQETLMKQANISNMSQLSKLENSLTGKGKTA
jgi:hypothetical protein